MGRLIYLMGSSGSGKDTLLKEISARKISNLVIAQRHITREVTSDENHHAVSKCTFDKNVENNHYSMHWTANGFAYGIDNKVTSKLNQGDNVIVNGSREYFPLAKKRFPNLISICLFVDNVALKQRLIARNRETEKQIIARLARNEEYQSNLPTDTIFIKNNKPINLICDDFLVKLKNHFLL